MVIIEIVFKKNKEKLIDFISKKEEVLGLYLFGSYADETYNENSDIDLAVVYDTKYDISNHVSDMIDIEKIFDNTRVDYINLDEVSLFFRFSILKNGVLLYTKNSDKLYEYVYKNQDLYIDMKYSRDVYKNYLLNNSSINEEDTNE